jgi:hypothetical protein
MALTYFPVTAVLKAINTDTSADVDGTPDTQYISSTVTFTPNVDQVHSTTDTTIYRLQPIVGRTNIPDGALKTIDGHTLTLVANTAVLDIDELIYTVEFTNVVYDKADREIRPFRFLAPTTATAVDLATVERLPD